MNERERWKRYQQYLCEVPSVGLRLDISRMNFDRAFLEGMAAPMAAALAAMERLEAGGIANLDENRMVGHYWLRAPALAPTPQIREVIEQTLAKVEKFAADVHTGVIRPRRGEAFDVVLVIGIGGSALGPQLLSDSLGTLDDPMLVHFLDNTDPDGFDRVLGELGDAIGQTLTVVISKSGGTIETRNAMLETAAAYRRAGLSLPPHAVAITSEASELHRKATGEGWLATFPMWDWVGGRTSATSAVGLLPAALQGIDVEALLAGARETDAATREKDPLRNPAALLAMMWHYVGGGRGGRHMVVLPYRDRLALFGRYLQQLVMESLGKEKDRSGAIVHQGLTVFGNKGTTDQHAFVQQLREGPNDFFVTFIDVRRDRNEESMAVEQDVTSGDYLHAYRLGTRDALHQAGRESICVSLEDLGPRELGALIALFERAVGLYAELINVNAYHQPGVEAGKAAASAAIALQRQALSLLREQAGRAMTADEIAASIGRTESAEIIFHLLDHAAASPDHGVRRIGQGAPQTIQFVIGGANRD